MSITEQERQAIDEKRRCFNALKDVAETAVAEGRAERFDDALVDFLVSARLIDERLGRDETLRRVGAIAESNSE